MIIGNFTVSFEGVSTDQEKKKDYYLFLVSRFDEKGKFLDGKTFYFAFKPHFKEKDSDLITELYRLPTLSRIAGAHIVFDVEK